MKIAVTGAGGFLGKNLCVELDRLDYTRRYELERDSSDAYWEEALSHCDFVFHLAGVNRPKAEEEYFQGNGELTEEICRILQREGRAVPLVYASSVQAENDSPYGKSKAQGEAAVLRYGRKMGAPVYIFRLPGLFGKGCRPFYNSVVATFCHQAALGEKLTIQDPEKELELCYIDDVLNAFTVLMEGSGAGPYREVRPTEKITVGALAERVQAFGTSRKTGVMPSLGEAFDRKLYATFLAALPPEKLGIRLEKKSDYRGFFAECLKSPGFGQISISRTKPGISRGNHWHHTKAEKFLVVEGEGIIRFRSLWDSEIYEYPVSGEKPEMVDVPPGYVHAFENTGETDMVTVIWAGEIFQPERPDTYSAPEYAGLLSADSRKRNR